MRRRFYIIALHAHGKILPETYELISFVRDIGGEEKTGIILGSKPGIVMMARELAQKTGMDIICATSKYLENYNAQGYKDALKGLIDCTDPCYICIPHTATGFDFGPLLGAALNIPCISAIEDVHDGVLIRSMFGGRIHARIKPPGPCAILTVQPGAWEGSAACSGPAGPVRIVHSDISPGKTIIHKLKVPASKDVGFADAEVIISAGRGIGSEQNLALIKRLAAMFQRSAIGATRAACDLGWLGYDHQIGVTGRTVSPRLYMACGISGAVQHISGMRNSRLIVAINTDPHAAIFRVASYCIVEDIKTFIPLVLEEYSRMSGISF
ncbi:MAG TPA: electron transfer flavoprotein subunit alpha/FixB family protein [Deltaproteobacteria bacterium]|nr:electron transfer flavoprotein subunit alpha/FixB family protein [Deltaproteobacteria bacterium]